MGRGGFVVSLFMMAGSSLVRGVAEPSFGWLVGGIVLTYVALHARQQLAREYQVGWAAPSGRFVLFAMLVLGLGMYALYWLGTSA